MIGKISDYIYENLKGFLTRGKKIQPPKSDFELKASRLISIGLFLLSVSLIFAAFRYGGGRLFWKSLVVGLSSFSAAGLFYKGVSISWMIRGLTKYWIGTALLIYIFYITVRAVSVFLAGLPFRTFQFEAGLFLFILAAVAFLATFKHVSHLRKSGKKGFAHSLWIFFNAFYCLWWVGFMGGGIVMMFEKQLDKLFN